MQRKAADLRDRVDRTGKGKLKDTDRSVSRLEQRHDTHTRAGAIMS